MAVGIRNVATPSAGSTSWTAWGQAVDSDLRALVQAGFWLDEYTGTDEQKLTSAIADQQAATDRNMPAIVLPSRPMSFTTPRTMYNGMKIVGTPGYDGQKNPDISSGQLGGPEITFGGTISSGTSSWLNGNGGSIFDVFMAGFQCQGSQGSSTHQFMDVPTGSLYACHFHSLSFNFFRGVFGRSDRKCLWTQVAMTGSWTMNNAWDTQMHVGGSDCDIAPAMNNIGVSESSLQTGTLTRYFLKFDSLEGTIGGKIYLTAQNGWRGMLLSGTGNSLDINGGVYEGFKPTRTNGLFAGPAPGHLIKITGGAANICGIKIGQGMDNPDVTEDGLLWITAGEVNLIGPTFYGLNMGTENAIFHTGGRLSAYGVMKRQNEGGSWSGRPRISTTATNGTGTYTFYNPDQSLLVV